MNKNLKQEIYKKKMLFHKFQKCRSSRNWENFRKQRNLVVSMKRKSMNKYFIDRCVRGCKSADFWPTIKPFLTNKGNKISKDVILKENNSLINDQNQICEVFNDYFFINVAKNIGTNSLPADEHHPSILKIKENNKCSTPFHFKDVDETFIGKQIDRLGSKKATGCDGISAKLLKLAKPSIVTPVTIMVNHSFRTSEFPDPLKLAQVAPIHIKNSTLEKGNYRPVSILPVISKIYERSINEQLSDFF